MAPWLMKRWDKSDVQNHVAQSGFVSDRSAARREEVDAFLDSRLTRWSRPEVEPNRFPQDLPFQHQLGRVASVSCVEADPPRREELQESGHVEVEAGPAGLAVVPA